MKKILALVLTVVMLLPLVGCGNTDQPDDPSVNTEQQTSGVSDSWMGADLNGVAGAVGGGWYSTFAAFTELVMEKEPMISFKVSPGSGIGNSATIGEGTFDMGWVYPPMAQLAYEGQTPYEEKYENIRMVATGLSPQVIEVVARASVDVDSIDDIFKNHVGIRWLTPNKGSTTPALFFDIMLQYYNTTESDTRAGAAARLTRRTAIGHSLYRTATLTSCSTRAPCRSAPRRRSLPIPA